MFFSENNKLSRIVRPGFIASAVVVLACLSGCGKDSTSNGPCEGFSKSHGMLPYLKQTTHPELSKEYALLVEQRHTPCQLVQSDKDTKDNAAVELRKVLKSSDVEKILEETTFIAKSDSFKFNYRDFPRIEQLAETYKTKNQLIVEAMHRPRCVFCYDHTKGFTADESFIDRVRAAVRLQEIAAADYLYNAQPRSEKRPGNDDVASDGKNGGVGKSGVGGVADKDSALPLEKTVDCVRTIFTLSHRLGQVKHVSARLVAAWIRREACAIVQAVVQDPRCDKKTLGQLQTILHEELARWTCDAEAWIGERAYGLYKYEAIRAGKLMDVLADDEEDRFRKEGVLELLLKVDEATIDADELHYLNTMRHVIDNCRRDFHQRPLLGSKIAEELVKLEETPRYPIIAGKLLLVYLDNTFLLQVADLARVRAWSVALDTAVGDKPTDNTNPINGKPFWIIQDEQTVTVHPLPPDEKTALESPLGKEAVTFLTHQLKQPIVVPRK